MDGRGGMGDGDGPSASRTMAESAGRSPESGEVVIGVDTTGVIVSVSDGCRDLLGWQPEDLVGTPLTRIIPARFHDAHRTGFERFVESGQLGLEGRALRLRAVHAVVGEIDVQLVLSRTGEDGAVVSGTLSARQEGRSAMQTEITEAVQRALAADLPLTALLSDCLAVAASRHGWAVAAVWWIDPWLDRLRPIAIWEAEPGTHPSYVEETTKTVLRRREGVVGTVWSTGDPILQADLTLESDLVRAAAMIEDGLCRGLFFPLTSGAETVGVVEMLDRRSRPFSLDDDEAVWGLADHLGRLVAERLRLEQVISQRQRIQTALSAGMMGVWSYHLETGLVTWDTQLEALYGLEPGTFGGSFADYTEQIHPDDREEAVSRITAAVDSGERFDYQYRAVRPDGSVIWLQGAGAPVKDSEGRLQALTGVCFDVTDRVEAQQLLDEQARTVALAADIGRALVGTDPVEIRLGRTVEAVVDRLDAAFARIWTLEPGADVLRLQASAGLYTHLDGPHSTIPVGTLKIGTIAATRRAHLTNDVANDPLISDPDWAEREGMVAFAGYPLVVGDQLVGVLALFARRPLEPSMLSALGSVADTVAIAILQAWAVGELRVMIDESRGHAAAMEEAMRDRARVAEVLQSSLLPPSLPEVEGLRLDALYRAGVEEVGGDFYDVLPVHDGWAFMIGDVCGRGPEAARLTALARHSIRTALLLGLGPSGALGAINESFRAAETNHRFCTVVCGIIEREDDGFTLHLAIGGHPPPLVVGNDGEVREVGPLGPLIGVFADPAHETVTVRLRAGEVLVLYTDGVLEARRGSDVFGDDRLRDLLAGQQDRSPAAIVDAIDQAVSSFAPAATDDVAILAIGVDPA